VKYLLDFLNFIQSGKPEGVSRLEFAREVRNAFYHYLEMKNFEYCDIDIYRRGTVPILPVLLPTADAPDIRAAVYTLQEPENAPGKTDPCDDRMPARVMEWRLGKGEDAQWIEKALPSTASIIRTSGDSDTDVIVGHAAIAHGPEQDSFFGFYFGGKAAQAQPAAEMLAQLETATYALKTRLDPEIKAQLDGVDTNLKERELAVLQLVANGALRADMAYQIGVSLATVDLNLASVRRRLGCRTLAEAVAKGYRYGLL